MRYQAQIRAAAGPDPLYSVIADLSTHLTWSGPGTGDKRFRLLTLDAPTGQASAGSTFTSTGIVQMGRFEDRSVVSEAVPGRRFAFDTESLMHRRGAADWRVRHHHRFTFEPAGAGAVLRYECDQQPENYVPFWLKPGVRALTRLMVERTIRHTLRSLDGMAAGRLYATDPL